MLEIKLSNVQVLVVFVCIGLSLGLQACTKRQLTVSDGGLISKTPCGPPCFWGITPGKSTEGEVVQLFEDKQIMKQCTRFYSEMENGSRDFICGFKISVSFQKDKDLVESVGFRPDNLTLGEVITMYGDPDAVLVLSGGTSQEHPPILTMSAYFEKIKTRVNLFNQEGVEYAVKGSTLISDVSYFDAPTYESMKALPLQKWKGFGDYQPSNR